MPKNLVFADQFEDPAVADALRAHTSERSHLLERLTGSLRDDSRVRAAWLWGSFLRGDSDDLSDLDLWLLVSDLQVDEMGVFLRSCCEHAGQVVSCGENPNNGPQGGGYLGALLAGSQGLHHVDIYWQPVGDGVLPEGPVLFDRLDEVVVVPIEGAAVAEASVASPESEQNRDRFAFIWLMLSVSAKYLARDRRSDMGLLKYPRNCFDELVAHYDLADAIGQVNWEGSEEPAENVELLRSIAGKTALIEAAACANGLPVSDKAHPCLTRYIDLVGQIVCSHKLPSQSLLSS